MNSGATGGTGANASSTKTFPSGLTATFAVAGGSSYVIYANNDAFSTLGGPAATMYTPPFAVTNSSMEFDVPGTGCPTVPANGTGTCSNRGTLTITFSRPVTNPVLHLAGLGGYSSSGSSITSSRAIHTLTGSSPAGATLTLLPGSVNLAVSGSTIDVANPAYLDASCSGFSAPATRTAGCGSVRVNGTVTSLTFRVDLGTARLGSGSSSTPALEGYKLAVSVDEDFGDAPASYDPAAGTTGAASHIVGGLRFGSGVTVDNASVQNPNSPAVQPSPLAGAGASTDADDGLSLPLPPLSTAMGGSTWSLSPALGNVAAPARVCGWVDFNRNGTFDDATERTCIDVAAGATAAALNWTVPASIVSTTPGQSYVRLRVAYGSGGMSATGRLDSGEVEDYPLTIAPPVQLGIAKTWVQAVVNDAVTVGVTGSPAPVGGAVLNAVANTADETDAGGTPYLVVAGRTYTVSESFTSGTAANYAKELACTGNTGTGAALAYTAGQTAGTITIGNTATAVTCTFRNTLRRADVQVVKTASPGSVASGQVVTYSIVVSNAGPAAADNLVLADTPSAGQDCGTPSAVATCSATGGAACPSPTVPVATLTGAGVTIPSMPSGGQVTVTLQCTVTASGF